MKGYDRLAVQPGAAYGNGQIKEQQPEKNAQLIGIPPIVTSKMFHKPGYSGDKIMKAKVRTVKAQEKREG